MEVGISSLHLIGKPFESLLSSIRLHDVRLWEIVDENSLKLNDERVRALRELKKEVGIRFTVHAPFTDINTASLVPEVREMGLQRLERSLRYASQLEAEVWVMHPGLRGALTMFYPEKEWQTNLESIAKMATLATEMNVQMCVENMPKGFSGLMSDWESFAKIYDELGWDQFKIALDVGHANTSGTVTAFLDDFKEQIVHVHAHDNRGGLDLHEEIGKGTVNWPTVARKIMQSSCRTAVVESTSGVERSLERLRELLIEPRAR
jgi:sugar phosphate isomerase/epimerase